MTESKYIYYNPSIFNSRSLPNNSTKKFVTSIKTDIIKTDNKIIYEKQPYKIDTKTINPHNTRDITTLHDFLLVFYTGNINDIVLLWYERHLVEKNYFLSPGRAILIHSDTYAHIQFFTKQVYENLFSLVCCNFSRYRIQNFVNSHESTNLNTNHDIV